MTTSLYNLARTYSKSIPRPRIPCVRPTPYTPQFVPVWVAVDDDVYYLPPGYTQRWLGVCIREYQFVEGYITTGEFTDTLLELERCYY